LIISSFIYAFFFLFFFCKGEFRPDELNVKVEGRMLIVKGDRQIKVGNATESKQFNRELTLPEFVDIQNLQSYLNDDGTLIMEAPVLLDRVYNDRALASSSSAYRRSASPSRLVDSTFIGSGRQQQPPPLSTNNYNYGNNQSSSYSTTSSSSSFRQDGPVYRDSNNFRRSSPLRDQYSSTTSSASTLIGGGSVHNNNNNFSTTPFSTLSSRPDYERNESGKNVTYKFNLSEFAPEDIAIQVNDTMLKITALKQERDGRGSSQREFRREIGKKKTACQFELIYSSTFLLGLPVGAEPKNLTNTLSADGILTIQIPVRDYRPPISPTYQTQQFNLPANRSLNDSYAVGDQQLKLTFDLSGYKPDDVSVKVNDNVLKGNRINIEENS